MRKLGLIVLVVLIAILALLLVLPNMKGCSASGSNSSDGSLSSLISRFATGDSNDGLCDFCGAPATMKKRGYEVCNDCYDQAVSYYNDHY